MQQNRFKRISMASLREAGAWALLRRDDEDLIGRNETMNAPLAKEQLALLMSDSLGSRLPSVQEAERGVKEARTSALVAMTRRVVAAVRYVADLPRRRAVIDELSRLTDRELADIGLSRSELKHIFANARA